MKMSGDVMLYFTIDDVIKNIRIIIGVKMMKPFYYLMLIVWNILL